MSKVRVLYDFQAEASGELTAMTNEELTVLNPNLYDGWIQVRNNRGQEGIVPSSYVEFLSSNDDDDIPPPPSSTSYINNDYSSAWNTTTTTSNTSSYSNGVNSSYINAYQKSLSVQSTISSEFDIFDRNFSLDSNTEIKNNSATNTLTSNNIESNKIADLAWGNDLDFLSSTNREAVLNNSDLPSPKLPPSNSLGSFTEADNIMSYNPPAPQQQPPSHSYLNSGGPSRHDDDDSDDFSEDETPSRPQASSNNPAMQRNSLSFNSSNMNVSTMGGGGTLSRHKTKNSYGLDVFLLHGAVKNVPDSDRSCSIILNENRQSAWKRDSPPYLVQIIGYSADKKYHGVKKFTSYEIQAKIFPQKVKRRYNHFDWLHKRLVEKYPNLIIPNLPDKAIAGNFEDEFIMKRKAQLELWLNKMASHPVVGKSEVFVHFLQCDEGSSKWKSGKRKAEKDEYRGAQWFCTLTVPGESVDTTTSIKAKVDTFNKDCNSLENSIKNVSSALDKIASTHSSSYKKEIVYLGTKLKEMGIFLSRESLDAPNNSALSAALATAGDTYIQIGNNYGEQAKSDIHPLLDRLTLYRSIMQQIPDTVQFEKNAIQTYEEFQQKPEKLEGRSLMEIAPRREIVSHVTFAEMNLFNRDKVEDMTLYMRNFLQQQISFYTEITECLKRAYANFEKIPVSSNNNSPGNYSTRR